MKNLMLALISAALMISLNTEAQDNLPFFDDFEMNISGWTVQNTISPDQWYWNNEEGYQGSNSVSFTLNLVKPYDINDAWLISPILNTSATSNIKVSFKYMRWGDYLSPRLYFTSNFTGDVESTVWEEIEGLSWEPDVLQYYDMGPLVIETPDNNLCFAFRYITTEDTAAAFYVDNFSVESYTLPDPMELVGSSEHFEFYTNLQEETDYWLEVKDDLENQFEKLGSLWNRPGIEDVINSNETIKVYYSAREDIDQFNPETPNWKCGFHDISALEIFLSPLSEPFQQSYYTNLQNLAKNEFSQLAISKKLQRDNNPNFPYFFLEGFGLYESGFRPRRDSIVKYLNENPVPDFNFVCDTSGISNTLKRDLIIGLIEVQLLTGGSYLGIGPIDLNYCQTKLPNYWKYFYTEAEDQRIKLLVSTTDFDFYGATSDSNHFNEIISYFENAYSFYIENYNFKPNHSFNVVIVPTETIGMELLNYTDYFNGGVACGGDLVIELSPNPNYNEEIYYSKYFGYNGMCAHEFFHIYYNHFMWEIPGGFWAEGTADFSQRHSLGWEIPPHSLWKIEWLFSDYAEQYNVDIDLEHISTNPNNEIDIYFFGDMFFEYLYIHHGGYEKIMEFFNQGMDYSVFDATYNEIDEGYINFLKVNNPNAVNQTHFNNEFKVYPNPLTEASSISFKTKNDGNVSLSVCNLIGQEILTIIDAKLTQGTYKYQIDKSKLTPGIYVVSLSTPLYQTNIKLVVKD